jgi:hypothetical protein
MMRRMKVGGRVAMAGGVIALGRRRFSSIAWAIRRRPLTRRPMRTAKRRRMARRRVRRAIKRAIPTTVAVPAIRALVERAFKASASS